MSRPNSRKIVSSWQLILLGSTAVVLSIASGWTTWDGMRNFTKEPLLSLMITFGIQGVMLIAAWLIGESFAKGTDQHQQKRRGNKTQRFQVITGSGIGITLFLALGLLLITQFNFFIQDENGITSTGSWGAIISEFRFGILAGLVIALLLIGAGRDVFDGYVRSSRVIVRNAVLWVMFLTCMAASVFFSFDSLFTTIFPENERSRAADIRARSEVTSFVDDIVDLTARRRLEQRTALLNSSEWLGFARMLDELASEIQSAPEAIDRYLQKRMLYEQEVVARRQAELSLVENDRVQLSKREEQLSDLVQQLQKKAARLETTVNTLNRQIFKKDREVIDKMAEAEAEASGIGVTSMAGRGPKYKELIEQLQRLKKEKKNLELQLLEYNKRLEAARKAVAGNEGKVAVIKTKLLQLQSQFAAGRQAGEPAQRAKLAVALRENVQTALRRLKSDRIAFEQDPTRAGLDALQLHCSKIVGLMSGSPILTNKVSTSSCDPGKTHEAAARLYALNSGATALNANCIGDKSLLSSGGVEPQLALARSCLQNARLLPSDTIFIRANINALERNRDDMAHRFVVSMNAFSDGNRLAYLALAIAIVIDALVFMSGLFGAKVSRSRVSTVTRDDDRTARQVEAMIEGALLPNVFENATFALETIKPVADRKYSNSDPNWTHEINLDDTGIVSKGSLQKLLNAGVTIRAVKRDATRPEHYFLRSVFIELLNDAARRAFISDQGNAGFSKLEEIVTVARRPDLALFTGTIWKYLHPSSERDGYLSQLIMSEVRKEDVEQVSRFLDAVATLNCVYCAGPQGESDRILIPEDLHRALSLMSAGRPPVRGELHKDPKVFLSDPGVGNAEQLPAGSSQRGIQHAGSDTPDFGRRTAVSRHQSDSPSAEAVTPVAHVPVTETLIAKLTSKYKVANAAKEKPKTDRPRQKNVFTKDSILSD